MTAGTVALAFSERDWAEDVGKPYLIEAGVDADAIEPLVFCDTGEALRWLAGGERTLLVLDADLPEPGERRDRYGNAALSLLRKRQNCGEIVPALVITGQRNNESELEAYCTPANRAIALQDTNFTPDRLRILQGVLGMLKANPVAAWTVMEVQVEHKRCTCKLGNGSDEPLLWEANHKVDSILQTAQTYDDPGAFKNSNWLANLNLQGRWLFEQHVINSLGRGMFAHIAEAAGGLKELAFRFKIEDVALYSVPFEGSVYALDEDPNGSNFVILHAPVVRWLPTGGTLQTYAPRTASGPVRMLFVRSQLCEHPKGPAAKDTLEFANGQRLSFRKLLNIDSEKSFLTDPASAPGADRLQVSVANLSDPVERNGKTPAEYLSDRMSDETFDIIHFAGHSWSSSVGPTAKTVLVLPGTEWGKADKISIEDFAELAGRSQANLIYMSSCEGSSARSVLSLVKNGVPHALGFRCDVEDAKAADFAREFYKALFGKRLSIPQSFNRACYEARRALQDGDPSPIWASPILIAQPKDWAYKPPREAVPNVFAGVE